MVTASENNLLSWGILGIDDISSIRRTRTLGLGSAIRTFNDLAVPGMGNVRFIKQLYLSSLGIGIAEKAREKGIKVRNIEVANALEALACRITFEKNNWQGDARLRGINKLKNINDNAFSTLRKPGAYVTQPFRMGTVQALPALQLVNSESGLFNSFMLSDTGWTFIGRISSQLDGRKNVIDLLLNWVEGSNVSPTIHEFLSPTVDINSAGRDFVKGILTRSGDELIKEKRNAILKWVNDPIIENKGYKNWNKRPPMISEEHWNDLHKGTLFFKTRDLAIELLNELEVELEKGYANKIELDKTNTMLVNHKERLAKAANDFLKINIDTKENIDARVFCTECKDISNVIASLVKRDGVGLELRGNSICKGHAFRGSNHGNLNEEEDEVETGNSITDKFPEHISYRVINMFYINQDLKGKLDKWFKHGN